MSQVLDRALSILERLGEGPANTVELAAMLGVHYSTTYRLLQDMEARRFVHRMHDGSYRIGAGFIYIAQKTLDGLDIRAVAAPLMRELHAKIGETVHLGQFEDDHVVYIEQVSSRHAVRMYASIGLSAPVHATAVAKSIIAFQPDSVRQRLIEANTLTRFTSTTITDVDALEDELAAVRRDGYALDREEHEQGIHCIAVPIRRADNTVMNSVSVAVPVIRMSREALMDCLPAVLELADEFSAALGARQPRVGGSAPLLEDLPAT